MPPPPPTVDSACWLGQVLLGFLTSYITTFFTTLLHGKNAFPSLVASVVGGGVGVFASSSGGGNPLLFTSGGGPPGLLFIFTAATLAVALGRALFGCTASLVPDAVMAGGFGSVAAGLAAKAAVRVREECDGVADAEVRGGDEEVGGGPTDAYGTTLAGGINYDELVKKLPFNRIKHIILLAIREEAGNPEVLMRLGGVGGFSLLIGAAYRVWEDVVEG
mmetsp:Transcript_17831/g.35750  ORF Transcript_17831/g.35750 Transcript_17831/m.35750 type:complete len:219 (-) Transcript_17831:28-684(-)|eukprot:CAMPEP_0182474162 /NCGR_PEP_ID=MMETSP1319-20130603/25192_1 /TAXON_ID=172717 /ORGANISM="Bolidomonas pacifica, Strain RCC208" /LENGTH=218 /DNA_ID=CAMNT_0024675029 /DNA_START=234 /DNA_END=890 /DNA_ORIENTATION=+